MKATVQPKILKNKKKNVNLVSSFLFSDSTEKIQNQSYHLWTLWLPFLILICIFLWPICRLYAKIGLNFHFWCKQTFKEETLMLINLTFLSLVLFLSFSLFYFSHLLPLCWSTHIDTWINWQCRHEKKDSNKQLLRQTRCLILMMRRRRRDGLGVRRCKTGRIYGHYGHWCWLLWWNDIFICSYSLLAQLHPFLNSLQIQSDARWLQ